MLFLPLAVISSAATRVFQSCKLGRATGCSEICLVVVRPLLCSWLFSLKLMWKPRSLSMLLFCLDLGGWRSQEVLLDIYLFDYLLKIPLPLVRPVICLHSPTSPLSAPRSLPTLLSSFLHLQVAPSSPLEDGRQWAYRTCCMPAG